MFELRPEKWKQGTYTSQGGRCCIVGAVHKVAYNGKALSVTSPEVERSKHYAYHYLQNAIDPRSKLEIDLEEWNDKDERTVKDILNVTQKALRLAVADGA
jgi:hypothetical protein